MTSEKLRAKLSRHNRLQIAIGSALCAAAPVLWVGSFWIGRYLFYLPFSIAGVQGMWGPSCYVAWAFTAILAFEGLRSSGPLFELDDFAQSGFSEYESPFTSTADTRLVGATLVEAWVVTQTLFLAPRTTVFAIRTLQSVTRASDATIEQAAAIFTALGTNRRWHAARDFGDCGPAIRFLSRLRLIWMQGGSNGLELRFPAGMSEAELV
ncbi:MAG TPA: hypothetical protein VHX65_05605 [Pirellulales bacterium]|jgi:hypothetical protein|nr:hypothetical protein [Pirellulales bacterium]